MKSVLNPLWPIEAITDTDQLMAIASGMEREAAERYEQLAARVPELSTLFRRLAELERAHEAGIGRWARRDGLAPPQPARFAWDLPETFGDESIALTPYGALAIAVRNEERAFAFYTYLAAMAQDGALRRRAESLAREELDHVAQLRSLRRRAFHDERPARRPAPRTVAALRRAAAALERELAQAATPRLALRKAEEIAELHLATAERAGDETLLREAQDLAAAAVARLARLRGQSSE